MLEPSNVVVVVGACGGIGSSLVWALERHPRFEAVVPLHRGSKPALDVTDEESVGRAAAFVRAQYGEVRCIVVATGLLHDGETFPERSLDGISAAQLSRYFAVNAIGPALVIKHFAPLLSRGGRSVIACLSARVGSISDNHLGGWYGYRASKAALNQLVRTAAIEIARKRPEAICVAIHPGTVDTALSAPFSKTGLNVRSAQIAGTELIGVLDQLRTEDNGCFLDYRGGRIEW